MPTVRRPVTVQYEVARSSVTVQKGFTYTVPTTCLFAKVKAFGRMGDTVTYLGQPYPIGEEFDVAPGAVITAEDSAVQLTLDQYTDGGTVDTEGQILSPAGQRAQIQSLVSVDGKRASQCVRAGKSPVGWTLTNTGAAASTLAMVANSPIDGLPGLRLTIPAGTATVDLNATGLGLANFTAGTGKLVAHLYIEDEQTIKQVRPYIGIAGLGRNMDRTYRISNDNDFRINGHHIIDVHPDVATANNLLTTDTVDDCRLRIDVQPTGNNTVIWIGGLYVPTPTTDRWLVITFDDADVTLYTRTHAELAKRGLRGTFGMNWDDGSSTPRTGVGAPGALFLTAAQAAEMYAYGHDLASHNIVNTAYPSVLPTGTQPTDTDRLTYCTAYRYTRNLMRSLGYTRGLGYHPFVQGRFDGALLDAMKAHGVVLARSAGVEGNVEPFMLNRQSVLWMRKLSNGASLAQAQGWIDTARTRAQDVLVMGHALADTSTDAITWAQANFAGMLDYALAQGFKVGPVSEWAQARGVVI